MNSPKHKRGNKFSPGSRKKTSNAYLKYSGMVFQIFVLLLLALWIGKKLDNYFELGKPVFTIVLLMIALVGYFYRMYIDLSKDQK